MEWVIALVIGVLFGSGVYLLLDREVFRIVLGTLLLSHGVNLMILTSGRLKRGEIPIIEEGITRYTDPLPQALILTAIVIGFGFTAFLLVVAYRLFQERQTDDLDDMKGPESHGS